MITTPGLFNGLAPLLANRTVILTVSADDKGILTLIVIPKKVAPDESDALTTPLWITATADELDRTLPDQLREYCAVHGHTASNLQAVKEELAAAAKAEREAADDRRAKKAKTQSQTAPATVARASESPQASLGLFDDAATADAAPTKQQQQQGEPK